MSLAYDSTQTLDAPLEAGQRVGTVTAMYQNIPLATAELVTLTAVERKGLLTETPSASETQTQTGGESGGVMKYWYLIVLLAVLLVLLCVLLILRAVNVRKAKKRAERRRRRAAQRRETDA